MTPPPHRAAPPPACRPPAGYRPDAIRRCLRNLSRVAGAGGIFGADRRFPAQEVEVAALVGLQHVVEEEAAVAPRVVRRAGLPPRAAMGKLIIGNPEGPPAGPHVPARFARGSG